MQNNVFGNASAYKQNSNLQYLFAQSVIKKANLINSSDRILDIGCGDGRITAEMSDMVPEGQVLGVDISPKMIEAAAKDHTRNNLGFMIMDAEKNIFRRQFDKIFSLCCLHWIKGEGQLRALKGIKDALTPNGKAILLIPLNNALDMHIESTTSNIKWIDYFKDFINPRAYFTQTIYSELLERSGFEKQFFQENIMSYEFETKRDMELFLGACLPQIKKIPESKRDEFLSDIVTSFVGDPLKLKKITYSVPMLEVHAIKSSLSLEEKIQSGSSPKTKEEQLTSLDKQISDPSLSLFFKL